ncbi:protein kinase domain-containing protein [Granulicoccus sp. GXG6511]|uniref:serine/threonine-protein kinase n=1 Tax=Granulicoccus sp. GXG6511 TaxID=3381351 RepID=UPI003D7CAE73
MQRIGRYRLVRRLGAGSFATVWLGRDDDLDVDVAVKVLADNWSTNDDVRNRFLAEARLMRRIRDERIVRVYDIGTLADGRPYFVMDYCDAGSLNDLRHNPIEPARTLRLCAEACRALHVLHRHHVIHRDVTPGNLLLDSTPDGSVRVLLADLGVAKEMVDQQAATMTAGTPAFMAPEQAMGGALGPWSDIYAMACVTHAVLTGRPPFAVKTVHDVMARGQQDGPAPLAARIGAPPELDGLLQAALSVDPARRPATAELMGTALDQLADATAGRAATFAGPPTIDPEVTRQRFPSPAAGVGVRPPTGQPPNSPLPTGQPPNSPLPTGQPPAGPTTAQFPPAVNRPAMSATPLEANSPAHAVTPAWQFWTLVGLIAALVFIGVMFLTLIAL